MENTSKAQFEHFILTRFNLATPGRESIIRNQEGWLDYRFDLFERYCAPSVASQSNKAFKWIIFFDEETPDQYKARVETLRQVVPFTPFYTGLFQKGGWGDAIFTLFNPKAKGILTTRLDSDDAISVDFVEKLHDEIEAQSFSLGAYNFSNGLIREGEALYKIYHETNAFFSLLEKNSADVQTAASIQHMKVRREQNLFQISHEASWMQIIHNNNVSNRVRGWRVVPTGLGARFPKEAVEGLAKPTWRELFAQNVLVAPMRFSRDMAVNIMRYGRMRP